MERIWDVLQIEITKDRKEIKKAYARLAKEIHPEEKPEEFQKLYEAYQKALQYASCGKRDENRNVTIISETVQKSEGISVSKKSRYEELGLDLKEIQKEKLRIEKINHFQIYWRKQIFRWRQGEDLPDENWKIGWSQKEDFPNENWKKYLCSEVFREIMWSPVVLEIIAEGIKNHFQQKEEILLFFCELYAIDKPEERKCNAKALHIYRELHPAYMESGRREQLQKEWTRTEKTAYFQCCWRKQVFVWENGGSFLGEGWKEYLQSEEFREIMWSPVVLGSIAKGMLEYRRQEEAALFFWNLYDFEKMGEENCKGQSLQLFRCLYPAYTNFLKRQQYAESKYERKREGRKRMRRIIAGSVGLLFIFLVMLYINADIALAVFGMVLIPFMIYVFYKWFFGV